eukprot:Clim_evm23s4 gene=Clim_evmTU23s4
MSLTELHQKLGEVHEEVDVVALSRFVKDNVTLRLHERGVSWQKIGNKATKKAKAVKLLLIYDVINSGNGIVKVCYGEFDNKRTNSSLKRQTQDFDFRLAATAETWTELLTNSMRKSVSEGGKPTKDRNILIFVNPNSGKRLAEKSWTEVVEPMLNSLGCNYVMHRTQQLGWAEKFLQDEDQCPNLLEYDTIMCVSGDGVGYEVINGLLNRSNWRECAKRISLALIPCGSGNGICMSLGHPDVFSACLWGLKGAPRAMDIMAWRQSTKEEDTVVFPSEAETKKTSKAFDYSTDELLTIPDHGDAVRFAALAMYWTAIADIDIESEKLRALGPARFTVGALTCVMKNRLYEGTLHLTPEELPELEGVEDVDTIKNSENGTRPATPYLDRINWKADDGFQWNEVVEGPFNYLTAMNAPWASTGYHAVPGSTMTDGLIGVGYCRRDETTRGGLTKVLVSGEKGKQVSLPFFHSIKTRALKLKIVSPGSLVLDIDGERVPYRSMAMEALPKLMTVYGNPKDKTFTS